MRDLFKILFSDLSSFNMDMNYLPKVCLGTIINIQGGI